MWRVCPLIGLVCLWACDDGGGAVRAPDTGPDAALDAGRDAATADRPPADVGPPLDAAPPDAAPIDASLAIKNDCPPATLVRLHDRIVLAHANLLRVLTADELERARREWPVGPITVAVAPGRPLGSAQIFVVSPGCRIEGLDEAAQPVWSVDRPGAECGAPAIGPDGLYVPITEGAGGALLRLALDGGELAATLALPGPPTTAPGYGGLDENGGSHWYVGVTDALVEISRDGVVGTLPLAIQPTHLALPDPRSAIVLGTLPGGPGPDHVQRVALGPMMQPVGPPQRLPGVARSAPVAVPGCDGRDANGGSHWWCDKGAFVLGGEGWLGAWSLAEERALFLHDQGDFAITGLAIGRDGRVYNGGSHWQEGPEEGSYRLQVADPQGVLALDSGPGVCMTAPLLDGDGALMATLSSGAFVTAATAAGGLATGWARAGGDNAGRQSPGTASGVCEGGDAALFERPFTPAEVVEPAALADLGSDVVVTGIQRVAAGRELWLSRVGPSGDTLWSRTYPAADLPNLTAPLAVGAIAQGRMVIVQPTDDWLRLMRVESDGAMLADVRLGSQIPRQSMAAAFGRAGTGAVVGAFPDAAPGEPDHWLLPIFDDGVQGRELALTDARGAFLPTQVALDAGGYLIAGVGAEGTIVRALTPAGVERWRTPLGLEGVVNGLRTIANGTTYALVNDSAIEQTTLVVLDATGAIVGQGSRPLLTMGLAVAPEGGGFVVAKSAALLPFTPAGALAGPRARIGGTGVAAVTRGDGAFLLVHYDMPPGALYVGSNAEGHTACAQAGRCVTLNACPEGDPCTTRTCLSETGACEDLSLPDGTSCGPRQTCLLSVCE
jgi:hypothetical protein